MAGLKAIWTGDKEFVAKLKRAGKTPSGLVTATGKAALRTQDAARRSLQEMVYAQPPAASGYTRTGRLRRSVRAASPAADHSSDHDAALTTDLAAHSPEQVAAMRGDQIESEVGSWVEYAEQVHEGINQPQPRPFLESVIDDAEAALAAEMEAALARMFN